MCVRAGVYMCVCPVAAMINLCILFCLGFYFVWVSILFGFLFCLGFYFVWVSILFGFLFCWVSVLFLAFHVFTAPILFEQAPNQIRANRMQPVSHYDALDAGRQKKRKSMSAQVLILKMCQSMRRVFAGCRNHILQPLHSE